MEKLNYNMSDNEDDVNEKTLLRWVGWVHAPLFVINSVGNLLMHTFRVGTHCSSSSRMRNLSKARKIMKNFSNLHGSKKPSQCFNYDALADFPSWRFLTTVAWQLSPRMKRKIKVNVTQSNTRSDNATKRCRKLTDDELLIA